MNRQRKKLGDCVVILLTVMTMIIFAIPIYLAVLTAFKSKPELSMSVLAFPKELYLDNFIEGMRKSDFFRSLWNSVLVTFPSVALIVLCSSMRDRKSVV